MTGERSPIPERRRRTDDELIDQELDAAESMEVVMTDATARVIASQLHGGQASDLYVFASTGYIRDTLMREIEHLAEEFDEYDPSQRRIAHLAAYLAQRISQPRGRQPVKGWSELWLRDSEDDWCKACGEHISGNHRVGCPLGVDDEDQLDRVLELHAGHGVSVLHYLNYLGFRSLDELNAAVPIYLQAYYGFYPDLDTFRKSYEMPPDEYLEQSYLIVEVDGGVYVFDR